MKLTFFKSALLLLQGAFLLSCSDPVDKTYSGKLLLRDSLALAPFSVSETDEYFPFQHTSLGGEDYLVSFTDRQLTFSHVFDSSKSVHIDLSLSFLGFSNFLIAEVKDSNLYVLDVDKHLFASYSISLEEKKLTLVKIFPIPAKPGFGISKERSIYYHPLSTFEVLGSQLFLAYCLPGKPRENYLDKTAYVRFDMTYSPPREEEKLLRTPKRYLKGKSYFSKSTLAVLTDSTLLGGFEEDDSLYIYNVYKRSVTTATQFSGTTAYTDYPKNKRADLAFLRNYDATNERNLQMLVNQKKERILIIKRIKKADRTDEDHFEYYLLNFNLEVLAFNQFDQKIAPQFCFPFKNGFLLY
ncbi:MAG: hypothetical protein EOP48_23165, partial [Sphingobacteriales bacterium]